VNIKTMNKKKIVQLITIAAVIKCLFTKEISLAILFMLGLVWLELNDFNNSKASTID
jgi:hypothetical protein